MSGSLGVVQLQSRNRKIKTSLEYNVQCELNGDMSETNNAKII